MTAAGTHTYERAQLPHFWEFTLKEYLELDESTYPQLLITVLFVIAKCGKQPKSHEKSRTDAGEPQEGGWQLEREQSVQGDIHRTHYGVNSQMQTSVYKVQGRRA